VSETSGEDVVLCALLTAAAYLLGEPPWFTLVCLAATLALVVAWVLEW
jgi:hypothetical protein